MSSVEPKLKPRLVKILVALSRYDRQVSNPELKKHIGTDLTGADNKQLITLGLVETERHKALHHRLTAAGRRYAESVAGPQLPPPPPPPPSSKLSPNQILALVVLMAEARELTNKELDELAGFSLTGVDREALTRLGLVETNLSGRIHSHQLTDKGWHAARTMHTSTPPKQSGSAIRSLFTLLANVHRSLERLHVSHAEFFKQAPVLSVEDAIRSAYRQIAGRPGNWVGLADLRDRLAGWDRSTVDETLRAMVRRADVRIIPVANSKALSSRDHDSAVRIGDADNHTISIGSS